ncbi:MAG TPA: MarR family transcriptional regulator [Beijerinckiaceae bacterium]|jgi:DNA-binding MarR family transcriptional regulator
MTEAAPTSPARPSAEREPTAARQGDAVVGELATFLGYALRRAQLAVFEDFRRSVGMLGMRPAQFSVLVTIDASPGLKQTEVAAALGIQRANFVAMVNELERRGWIERRPLDRRSLALHLTEAGAAKLAEGLEAQRAMEARYERILGPGGRQTLLDLLGAIQRAPGDA